MTATKGKPKTPIWGSTANGNGDTMPSMPPLDEDTRLERLKEVYEQQQAAGEQTGAIDAELLHDVIVWIRALRDRAPEVVDVLPASAPLGKMLAMANDPNLYIGTGAGRPLRRIPTLAL